MATGGGGCLRTAGIAMLMAVIFTLMSILYESDLDVERKAARDRAMSSMGGGASVQSVGNGGVHGFAQAMPVGQYSEQSDGEEVQVEEGFSTETERSESSYQDDNPVGEPYAEEGSGEKYEEDTFSDPFSEKQGAESEQGETDTDSFQDKEDGMSPAPDASQRRSRAKTFLVVFMGHSGSTAYITELRAHSEFEVELLEPVDHGEYEKDTDLALKRARELMDRGIAKGKIPGFKIRPLHIQNQPEAWQEFVKEYDTRVIWQYRENIVKQAIGEYRSRFLNDSSVIEGLHRYQKVCDKDSGQKCSFRIDNMKGLHGIMNDFTKSDELLADAARSLRRDDDMMIVRYEDYLYRRDRTMRETFDFFGVDYQDTAPQRLKASPDSLCEMVINYQDLCDHFLPCQLWRPYLQDDVNNCRCKPGSWNTFDSTFCKRESWYQGNR